MKLNKQAKNELRTEIIKQLKKIPNNKKINLDKDLLFEVITLDKEKNIKIKLPV